MRHKLRNIEDRKQTIKIMRENNFSFAKIGKILGYKNGETVRRFTIKYLRRIVKK